MCGSPGTRGAPHQPHNSRAACRTGKGGGPRGRSEMRSRGVRAAPVQCCASAAPLQTCSWSDWRGVRARRRYRGACRQPNPRSTRERCPATPSVRSRRPRPLPAQAVALGGMHRGRRLRRKIRLCADLVRGNESALPPRSVDCACSRKRSKARPLVVQEAAPEVLEPQRRTPKLGEALGVALSHAAARRVNANEALAAVNCTAPRNRARPRFADRRGRTGPGRATPRERKLHSRPTLQRPQLLRVQPQARRVKPRQLTQALRQAAKLPRRPRREILRLRRRPSALRRFGQRGLA